MDPEVEKKLASIIAKEDECRVALEVSKDDAGKLRIIAIVCPQRSSSQPEYALFVIKKKKLRSKLTIRHAVPILSDFSVRRINTLSVEVKYRKYKEKTKTKVFTASNADALGAWIEVASNALVVACHQNYNLDSFCARKSHAWLLERYADDVSGLKQMLAGPSSSAHPNSDGSDSNDAPAPAPEHPVALTMMTATARNDWINKQCLKRADEYVQSRQVSVRVCSWNVGALLRPEEGKGPPWHPEMLQRWMIPRGTVGCDIISIGLQEIVELQTNSLIAHDASPERTQWEELLCQALQVPKKYVMLVSRQYVGIYHFLAVKKELWEASIVREPQCKAVGCGIMGYGGNKGAVSVRILVYDSPVCFVCCHLAAGRAQVERRNRDHKQILKSTLFDGTNLHGVVAPSSAAAADMAWHSRPLDMVDRYGAPERVLNGARNVVSPPKMRPGTATTPPRSRPAHFSPLSPPKNGGWSLEAAMANGAQGVKAAQVAQVRQSGVLSSSVSDRPSSAVSDESGGGAEEEDSAWGGAGRESREGERVKGIEDHDVVIWLGDLNYRVDMERDDALHEIARGDLRSLWERDQLRKQREEGAAFVGYVEGRPTFMPTYKLDPATGDYYNRSDKIRTPSWCDRVLWRTTRGECTQVLYDAEEYLPGSDHRAIGTTLQLTVEEVLAAKKCKVRDEVEAELDQLAGECLPQAAVDIEEVVLQSVRYRRREKREVRLRNVGQVVVHFQIATQMRGDANKAAWMQATPDRGVLMPSEAIKIDVVVHVGDRAAGTLLLGDKTTLLEALLTFQINGGPSASHPTLLVRAHCLPTCFGRTLADMASRRWAVRAPPPAGGPGKGGRGEGGEGSESMLPKEIWRLVGALYDRGLRVRRLFLDYGSTTEAAEVRECLDTGRAFPCQISPHALGEVLLQLLRSMPCPVVTPAVRDQCVLRHQSAQGVMEALAQLPPHHTAALVYIVSFLRALPAQVRHNSISAEELALVFAGALLSPDRLTRNRATPAVLSELRREQAVMIHLLCPQWRVSSAGL